VDRWLDQGVFAQGDLIDALMNQIREQTQIIVTRADFRLENIPVHCLMNYRLLDQHGRQMDLSRHLAQLRGQYAGQAREIFQEAAHEAIQKTNPSQGTRIPAPKTQSQDGSQDAIEKILTWSFGELPEMLEIQKGQQTFYGYPALDDCMTHCELSVYDDPALARQKHYQGLRRLCQIAHKDTLKILHKQLPGAREIGMLFMQIGAHEDIMQQILDLAIERTCLFEPLPSSQEEFATRMQVAKTKLSLVAQDIAKQALLCLELSAEIPKKLNQAKSISPAAHEDILGQYQLLIHSKFIAQTPYEQLVHIPRYLKGIVMRIEKLRSNQVKDQENQKQWTILHRKYLNIIKNQTLYAVNQHLLDIRWQMEELRIAMYAQELKTPTPMSIKRIEKILNTFRG
jgi:ATP-dependent helicase HrpA